jgi:pimeloyl-ACP methyl ester carboxylesterase
MPKIARHGNSPPGDFCLNINIFTGKGQNKPNFWPCDNIQTAYMKTQSGTAYIGDAEIFYKFAGSGRPLLLIHSGIADHRMWEEQIKRFSEHFLVIAPDFRGYGRSSRPEGPFRHRDDMRRLIDNLDLESVYILGSSLGGMVAMELALGVPERVKKLVLAAPGMRGWQYRDAATLEKDIELEGLLAAEKWSEAADLLVDIWVAGLARSRDSVSIEAMRLVRQMIMENQQSVFERYPEASPEIDIRSRLKEIKAPALVMIGDKDLPDMLEISGFVAGGIPGAISYTITNAAHLPNLEHPVPFERVVLDFLLESP